MVERVVVTDHLEATESEAANAARELMQLHGQAEELHAVITHLELGVAEAEDRLGNNQALHLVEANERLVIAALSAQSDGETASRALTELARSAKFDALTELPNRVLLLDRFAHAIASAKRHGARLALLFLDLNNFKQINDTLGHAVGDQVLKLTAHCLASSVREADTVSRHGGDEFLILLTEVSEASNAILVADKVIAALGAPRRIGDHEFRLTASIGISLYPDDGGDPDTLIDRADAAMYRAKREGLGSFAFHGGESEGERRLETPAHAAPQPPATHYELAVVEHERRHAQLREVNEQLILAALSAQELQAAEQAQPYRVLIEQMQEGAVMLSDGGTVLYCNQRFSTIVDTPRAAILGQVITRFFSGAEADAFFRSLARGPGGGASGEFTLHAADGAEVPVNISLVDLKVDEGMPRVVCGVVTDLTLNRKRSHELTAANARLASEIDERRRAEESLQLALDAADMGNWDLDLATDTARRSPRHDQIFGHSQLLPAWGLAAALEQFLPEDRESVAQAFAQATASGSIEFERRIRRASDGAIRWLHMKGQTYYEAGRPVRIAGVVTDVTERLATEEQLRQALKMEAVGQLTGGIAHDFNNLLQGIVGSLDLMQKRIAEGRIGEVQPLREAAMHSAQRAAALTHRLLAFSRRQPLDPKTVRPNQLIASMEDLLRRTMGERINIELRLDPGLWPTCCDPNQLESALLNLAINARDAMPDGGKLTIATQNVEFGNAIVKHNADLAPGQYLRLAVTDTGIGMAPDVVRRAFDPFFTTKPLGHGTGLGLSMIYGFAHQSQGYAEIDSRTGAGSTVALYLPHITGDESIEEESLIITDAHAARAGEVILVVEDESVVRALVIDVLHELGYQTLEAADGIAGLSLLQSNRRIDLLVSDVGLPGLNGRQMAEAGREKRSDLKVLFMTGYAETATVARDFLGPGMALIAKPFALEVLATRVREMLEARSCSFAYEHF